MSKASEVKAIIESTNGQLFNVTFIKKDGSERNMTCRTGVKKYVTGNNQVATAKRKQTLKDNGMVGVFEMQGEKQQYRTVNCNTVKAMKVAGVYYKFND